MKNILVVSKIQNAYETIKECMDKDYHVDVIATQHDFMTHTPKKRYEFLLIDIDMLRQSEGDNEYKSYLQKLWSTYPDVEIIVLTVQETIRQAVYMVKAGASDYLIFPVDPVEVKYVIENIRKDQILFSELKYLRNQFLSRDAYTVLNTKSPMMKDVFKKVRAVAPTETTVLLTGETGTGKGVIAKLIHEHSRRKDKQFIHVHCGAISDTLLESELFGHEKGAFTGAHRQKLGKFEISQGGTIFLDEIATMSGAMQVKLLQVLQERIFHRVGGENIIQANVRIIVATNMDLKKMCEEGSFRRDLYYRLQVFPIDIPSLSARVEDIPLLVETFLERLNHLYQKNIKNVHSAVLEAFHIYDWPGNIRELENLIERAYVIESSNVLKPNSFPMDLFTEGKPLAKSYIDTSKKLNEVRKKTVEEVERLYLYEMLDKYKGRIRKTAEATGVGVRMLHKLLVKHGIDKKDFK